MSGVVLRCRTCGTPQDHPGECDACGEGPVAYFCGNHDGGLWLDGAVCHTCGARFGDAVAAGAPASRTSPSVPRVGRRPPTSGGPWSSPAAPPASTVRRVPPRATPPPAEVTESDDDAAAPSLAELLVDMAEEGRRAREVDPGPPSPVAAARRVGVPIVGCLFRLLLFVVLLAVLALAAVSILVNGVL